MRRHDNFSGYVYTELTDVEYELCGIYDFDRAAKPDLDCDAAAVNGETVLILDHIPRDRGLDYLSVDGRVQVPVRISHHGRERLEGALCWRFAGSGESARAPGAVEPFVCSEPIDVSVELPDGVTSGRLEFWFEDDAGAKRAATHLDVGTLGQGSSRSPAIDASAES